MARARAPVSAGRPHSQNGWCRHPGGPPGLRCWLHAGVRARRGSRQQPATTALAGASVRADGRSARPVPVRRRSPSRRSTGAWRRSATSSSSPAPSPRSRGCRWASASPSCTSAACASGPGVLIGDLLANDYGALPLGSALGQTTGNVLEVARRDAPAAPARAARRPARSVADLARMVVAIAAGTAVSATVGTLSLRLGAVIAADEVPGVWRTWWLGDASGALLVLPLALAWARPPPRAWWRRHGPEAALMLLALVALSELAMHANRPQAYIVFPALIWAALRLGRRGATVAVAVAAGFAIWETTRQVGPFAYGSADVERAQHPAVPGRLRALDAVARGGRGRARELRGEPGRFARAARRDRRQRAPADRAQPPRRRAAAADGAARPPAARRRPGASRPGAGPRHPGGGREPSSRRRSTSCASSHTGSTLRRSRTSGSPTPCDRSPRDRRSRSACSISPPCASTTPPRRPPTSSSARRSPTRASTPARRGSRSAPSPRAGSSGSRSPTTGAGARPRHRARAS